MTGQESLAPGPGMIGRASLTSEHGVFKRVQFGYMLDLIGRDGLKQMLMVKNAEHLCEVIKDFCEEEMVKPPPEEWPV